MKSIIFPLSILCFMLTGSPLLAQKTYEWKEQTAGAYTYRYITNDPFGARYYVLPNGLTVITSVNKREPRLQTIIATKAGSKTDPANHTGLAHYLEHMLFKGTDKYGTANWAKEKPLLEMIDGLYEKYNQSKDEAERKKIYRQIDSVSGVAAKFAIANEYDNMMASIGAKGTNAFTWFEETAYINDIPNNRIDQWLKVEAERFRNPVFRIFHTELEAVYEEKNISLDSDDEMVIDSVMGALFRRHNYGLQTTIGTIEHLKNPSLKEIRKYFETYYVPNNMCVILAGDFNPDEAIKKVDAAFGYMKRKPVPEYVYNKENDIQKPVEISVYGKEAEYVSFAFRFPGASGTDTELLETLEDLLSNGKAGLLDGMVTRREVLAADAGSFILKDYSVLYFSGTPKEGQTLEQVKDLILGQIEKLKKGEFDDNLIKAIVNNKKLSDMRSAESNGGRAFNLLDAFVVDRDRAGMLTATDKIGKLTKKDITAYAQKYLSAAPVIVYKRLGENPNVQKVDKPAITAVEVNRDKESPFVKEVLAYKPSDIKITFPDFKKDITRGSAGPNELLYVKNNENDIFSLNFVVPIGKKYSPNLRILQKYFGYAGTVKMSAEDYDKELYKIACSVNFYAGDEESYISLTGLNENFDMAYRLFLEKLKNLQTDQTVLNSVKEIILKERADAKKDPEDILGKLFAYGFYDGKNNANNVLTNDELKALPVNDLKTLMDEMMASAYRIMYYGPYSYAEFEGMVNRNRPLTLTPQPAPAAVKFVDLKLRTLTTNEIVTVQYDKVQTDIVWVCNGADFKTELLPVVSLYNEYFGGGMSSVVFQEIRESKALAYSTYSDYSTPAFKKYPFRFYAYIGCQADKMGDALKAMNGLLQDMPKSESKFTAAKSLLRNSLNSSAIVGSQILFEFLRSEKLGLDVPEAQYVLERIGPLTLTDVVNFQKQYIAGKPRMIIVFGDFSKLEKEALMLKRDSEVKSLGLEEIYGY